jgi:hypothetical protein
MPSLSFFSKIMSKSNKYLIVGIAVIMLILAWANGVFGADAKQIVTSEKAPIVSGQLSLGYDSKYIFRGVNVIPKSGLGTSELNVQLYDFSFNVWGATGTDVRYQEIDFAVAYAKAFLNNHLTLGIGYTHYTYPSIGVRDSDEVFVYASTNILQPYITPTVTYYRSLRGIVGGYLEAKVETSYKLCNYATLKPYALVSYDLGYNVAGNNDFNNFQIGTAIEMRVGRAKISPYVAYSIPLEALKNTQTNEFWGGVKINFEF